MTSTFYNGFSEGPAMILSPSQNHPSFQFPSQSIQGLQAFDSGSWSMDAVCANQLKTPTCHSSSWTPASSSAKPIFTNPSRKRSRGDSEDDDCPVWKPNSTTAPALSRIRVNNGAQLSARVRHTQDISARDGSSRKSQRLDSSATGLVESRIQQPIQSTTKDDDCHSIVQNSPFNMADEPRVDDVTLLLGISWQRVSHEGDMAPAVSGWEKYINNHFYKYLRNARIVLKNRSLNAYLVAAPPAHEVVPQAANATTLGHSHSAMPSVYQFDPSSFFFLFNEDLTEAQLVSSTLDNCLQNLRSSPIQFEGTEVLRAIERSPERTINYSAVNSVVGNGIPIALVSKNSPAMTNDKQATLSDDVGMSMGTDMEIDS